MTAIRKEDIIAYNFDGDIYCTECVKPSDLEKIELDQIITGFGVDDSDTYYFCDGCQKCIN